MNERQALRASSVRRTCPKRPRACRKCPTSTCSKSRPTPPRRTSRRAVEKIFDVKVEAVNVVNVKGKRRPSEPHRPRGDWRKAYVKLAEGQSIDVIGQGLRRSTHGIDDIQTHFARPPLRGPRRDAGPAQGRAVCGAGRERRARPVAATTTAASPRATTAAARKQHYRIIDFKRDKEGIPARVERIEYDPNRTAHIALLCYVDGERRYIIAPKGLKAGDQVIAGTRCADQDRQHAAAAQHPGRLDRALHRDEAGQGCADRAQRRRSACSWSRAKASTPRCVCAPAKCARCRPSAAPRSAKSATTSTTSRSSARPARSAGAASRPTVRGAAMNPVDHPHGGGEAKAGQGNPHPVTPWGEPTKGYKTRHNKRTTAVHRARPSGADRAMPRSLKKGPFVDHHLMKKVETARPEQQASRSRPGRAAR